MASVLFTQSQCSQPINIPVGCLSPFLTSLVVHDPPWLEAEHWARRVNLADLDLFGLGLIALKIL